MGNIHYYRYIVFLHIRDIPEIYDKILVTEHIAPVRKHYRVVSGFPYLFNRKSHRGT